MSEGEESERFSFLYKDIIPFFNWRIPSVKLSLVWINFLVKCTDNFFLWVSFFCCGFRKVLVKLKNEMGMAC